MSAEVDVVVVGAGVAGLTAAWALRQRGLRVLTLESSPRAGGAIESERTPDGFLVEYGPDGFLGHKPAGMHLVRALGLEGDIVRGGPAPRRAFVASRSGRLEPIPAGLFRLERSAVLGLLGSGLLSVRAKARLLTEPFVAPAEGAQESVHDFFARRLGPEVADRLVDPLLRGVYGTSTTRLGMEETMPTIAQMEREKGSLARALIQARGSAHGEGLVTLRSGMGALVSSFAASLGASLRLGARVRRIQTSLRRGVVVDIGRLGRVAARAAVLACPAWCVPELVSDTHPDLADELEQIEYSSADIVNLAYRASDVPRALAGTGFVVDPAAGRALAACTWSSQKWRDRAPGSAVLLRAILSQPDADDEEVVRAALGDLRDLIGVEAAPLLVRARRRRSAMPVAAPGHRLRVARARRMALEIGDVVFAGSAYGGMGVPDCIASGLQAAASVVASASRRSA